MGDSLTESKYNNVKIGPKSFIYFATCSVDYS